MRYDELYNYVQNGKNNPLSGDKLRLPSDIDLAKVHSSFTDFINCVTKVGNFNCNNDKT